jgi:hypothetical protein
MLTLLNILIKKSIGFNMEAQLNLQKVKVVLELGKLYDYIMKQEKCAGINLSRFHNVISDIHHHISLSILKSIHFK